MSKEKKENPNAFKHWFNEDLLKRLARGLQSSYSDFDSTRLIQLSKSFAQLEMKARVHLIRDELRTLLPSDYSQALQILLKSVKKENLSGFDLWPYTEFIQAYGLNHFDESLDALRLITQKFTAEFAIRPFLVEERKKTFDQLLKWSTDSNHHVRRWCSEGTRPRLPWGLKLHDSIKDPKRGIEILENLKLDEVLYVRKSVANHLNDIAKDHPELVVKTLKSWRKTVPQEHKAKLDWIQKHALRSLIKAGHPAALNLMGYGKKAEITLSPLKLNKKNFRISDLLSFEIQIKSKSNKKQKLAVDYIVFYQKANKKTSPKVFKLKVLDLKAFESIKISKNHSLKPVTTRKYYSGLHKIAIQVNGQVLKSAEWTLKV